jgi:penicillin-binding protein 2
MAFSFLVIMILFGCRIFYLQIVEGKKYKNISENNRLHHSLVFAERGSITDRNGKLLAWNTVDPMQTEFSLRSYTDEPGMSHLLGYVKYPKKDKFGFYYNTEYSGFDGLEKYYNSILSGIDGLKITETDALQRSLSESVLRPPKKGEDVVLSIDQDAQKAMYLSVKEIANRSGFSGGAAIVMDVETGEVITSVTYPEYDSNVMTSGKDVEKINSYLHNSNNPFLDRVSDGLYTPGSIMKPIFAFAALSEGIISPEKQIESTGKLKVPNPYKPGEFSVFNDWKAHGWTDMRRAIAVSSDVYFYQIGGGYPGQKGLGIDNIDRYARLFGFGESIQNNFLTGKKGVIPTPQWKKENFNGDIWRLGDTYNTAIGQYGFQVTLVQVVRAIGAFANNGNLLIPTLFEKENSSKLMQKGLITHIPSERVQIDNPDAKDWYRIVREGMRMTVTDGTMQVLNLPYVKIAGKTGTAQLGISKKNINSWAVGFFPYQKPKYAFAVMMEKGPSDALYGATAAFKQWIDWIHVYEPEYLGEEGA